MEMTATMTKMNTDTAAANPYSAPEPPKASRYVYVMSRSVAPLAGLSAANGAPSVVR